MLSKENNERLTRVSAGTPMGDLMRQYWHPFLYPSELEADGSPLRVRLLGEDLIAFRTSDGSVGLVGDHCPHRGASLFFGRNEEAGLRCVYHGWKFDVSGACVDMPNEPPESNFKERIHHIAYPCLEKGGMIWTYMGPETTPPPLPALEFLDVSDDQRFYSKRVQTCNWVQAMEGDIDQSHNSFLHTWLDTANDTSGRGRITEIRARDRHPVFEAVETDYGVCVAARRQAEEDTYYIRITQFLMPNHTMTGPYGDNPVRTWRGWVPIDDENTLVHGVNFHPLRALQDSERGGGRGQVAGPGGYRVRGNVFYVEPEDRAPVTSRPFGAWYPLDSLENDLRVDRHVQKTLTFSGIPVFWAQDGGTQLTMGKIFDRTREHLGTTDLGIIATRRKLLNAAAALRENGTVPPGVRNPERYQVRAAAIEIKTGESWYDASQEQRKVLPGVNQAGV
jgi:phthalate 4,5-dioxygenase oxygenase subunit